MIKDDIKFADEDKKENERVDAKNAFDGDMHSMRTATKSSREKQGKKQVWKPSLRLEEAGCGCL